MNIKSAFSGFSVSDNSKARTFYKDTLNLTVEEQDYGTTIHLPGGATVFFYPKGEAHVPANYTILNFEVDDIDAAVNELKKRGVTFQSQEHTDEKGIQRGIANNMGPDIAWFTDPAGNILSIMQNQ